MKDATPPRRPLSGRPKQKSRGRPKKKKRGGVCNKDAVPVGAQRQKRGRPKKFLNYASR